MTQNAQFASKRYLCNINLREVKLAWLIQNLLRPDILIRRLVSRIKRAIQTDISVLVTHLGLVAVLCILLIKVVDDSLLDCHFVQAFLPNRFCRSNFDVDFRSKGSEVFVEAFFATKRMIRIEHIEGLHIELVTSSD